jgi:glc operon protein GlcG
MMVFVGYGSSTVLKRREPLIQLPSIEYAEAKRVIDAITEEISRRGKAGVIAVADPHGELIAFARMDGAPYSSILIATNKAYTAARERKATKEIGEAARHPEKGFDIAYFGEPRFVGWGGGVPVCKDGTVIGSVAVSGLPQTEDVELAKMGAEMISQGS